MTDEAKKYQSIALILIHTSVKLVTRLLYHGQNKSRRILIHTSVKLVTQCQIYMKGAKIILIHTSVKLVTSNARSFSVVPQHFNPHEREARD